MITRNGLAESLEDYAKRATGWAYPADLDVRRAVRGDWIREGLRLLGAPPRFAGGHGPAACRVAPGVAVPVRFLSGTFLMTPADVIEVEP